MARGKKPPMTTRMWVGLVAVVYIRNGVVRILSGAEDVLVVD